MSTTYQASGTVTVKVETRYLRVDDLGSAVEHTDLQVSHSLANGSGDNQINLVIPRTYVIDGSDSEVIWLSDDEFTNSFTDGYGRVVTFIKLKTLLLKNRSAETLTVTSGILGILGDFTLAPGGCLLLTGPADGFTLPSIGSIEIENESATDGCEVDVLIVGTGQEQE